MKRSSAYLTGDWGRLDGRRSIQRWDSYLPISTKGFPYFVNHLALYKQTEYSSRKKNAGVKQNHRISQRKKFQKTKKPKIININKWISVVAIEHQLNRENRTFEKQHKLEKGIDKKGNWSFEAYKMRQRNVTITKNGLWKLTTWTGILSLLFFSFNVYLFILRERETEREQWRERRRQKIPSRLLTVGTKPELDLPWGERFFLLTWCSKKLCWRSQY